MLIRQEQHRDALIDVFAGLLQAVHHKLVAACDLIRQSVLLLNLREAELDELLSVEGKGLIDSSVHEKRLSVLLNCSSPHEALSRGLACKLNQS